jgi:molybdenum cofactor biosynthesis enzyme MoaA
MITCIDAFKNLNILNQNNSLALSPCCYSPSIKVEIIDFKNNTYLNRVRSSCLYEQFPSACRACNKSEQQGYNSRRIGSNQWYQDHNKYNTDIELIRLDYWTGDQCNLRCAICGPHNSSAWKEELKLDVKKSSINRFWKELDLSKLKFIHFNGGEPLLSKEHVEFLHDIPDKSQVAINYNTNGTVLPTKKLRNLWEEFRLVQLDFSIDDIEDRFEYQRYPAKWAKVTENLQWYIDNSPVNCMFAVNTTVSILNYANLDNLNTWLKTNFNANRVTDPVEHRQQPAAGLFAIANRKLTTNMIEFLNACDQRRGTDWQQTFPELRQSE